MDISFEFMSEDTYRYFILLVEVDHYLDVKPDSHADNTDDFYGYTECEWHFVSEFCKEVDEEFNQVDFNEDLLTEKDMKDLHKIVIKKVKELNDEG